MCATYVVCLGVHFKMSEEGDESKAKRNVQCMHTVQVEVKNTQKMTKMHLSSSTKFFAGNLGLNDQVSKHLVIDQVLCGKPWSSTNFFAGNLGHTVP